VVLTKIFLTHFFSFNIKIYKIKNILINFKIIQLIITRHWYIYLLVNTSLGISILSSTALINITPLQFDIEMLIMERL
jgi:hypothetical protein